MAGDSIEMRDMAAGSLDLEAQTPLVIQTSHQKSRPWYSHLCVDITQAVQACGCGSSSVVAGGGAVVGVVGLFFISDPVPKYVVAAIGFGATLLSSCSALSNVVGCIRIGMLKPEEKLESQLEHYKGQNEALRLQNDNLRVITLALQKNGNRFNSLLQDQERQIEDLDQLFAKRIGALTKTKDDLAKTQRDLDKTVDASKGLEKKIKETQELVDGLSKENDALKNLLKQLNVAGDEIDGVDETWDENVEQLSGENDEFRSMNHQLAGQQHKLGQQIAFLEKVRQALEGKSREIKQAIGIIDEADDKVLAAATAAQATAAQDEAYLKRLEETIRKQKEALSQLKEGLVQINDKGQFSNLISVIDTASEASEGLHTPRDGAIMEEEG